MITAPCLPSETSIIGGLRVLCVLAPLLSGVMVSTIPFAHRSRCYGSHFLNTCGLSYVVKTSRAKCTNCFLNTATKIGIWK